MTTNNDHRDAHYALEQIKAAAKAHCDFFGGEGWWETGLIAETKPKAIKAMRAALATLPAPSPADVAREGEVWMPIKTAPKDGTRVLVYLPADDRFQVKEAWSVRDMSDPQACSIRKPTHWMLLPAGPGAHPHAQIANHANCGERLAELLTKAIGDISAALVMAGKEDKITSWTAPHVQALNDFAALSTHQPNTTSVDVSEGTGGEELPELVIAGPWIDGDNTDEDDQPVWRAEVHLVGGYSVIAETWGGSFEQALYRAEAIRTALASGDTQGTVGEGEARQ